MYQPARNTRSRKEKHLQRRASAPSAHDMGLPMRATRGYRCPVNSHGEGAKEVEKEDEVGLVHGDLDSAGVGQVREVDDQTDISLPHVTGVRILCIIHEQLGEVGRVSDGGVGEGEELGSTYVSVTAEGHQVSIIVLSLVQLYRVSEVGQHPEVLRHCRGETLIFTREHNV